MDKKRDGKKEKMKKTGIKGKEITRRDFIKGAGALGLGAAAFSATSLLPRVPTARGGPAMDLRFWTWENPQQRPWLHKRIKLYMEKNPNVKVEFQYFTFSDLGKKVSVGFATGTAPEGFTTGDWLMPTWLSRDLIAPLDVQKLGYNSVKDFENDYPPAFVAGSVHNGKVYGYPIWFYGYLNYINNHHFKEVGLDPVKDQPKTWKELGETAAALTIQKGDKFERQGFKFAMHAAMWTMIQFNPILLQCGGKWFHEDGTASFNNAEGVKAMEIRASIARKYHAEDPADTIATQPLPQMDWLKERCSMFCCHPIPPVAIASQNPVMEEEHYYSSMQMPGMDPNDRYTTSYGFNFLINKQAPKDKQEVLHDMYAFIMSDLKDCWKATAPFPPARKTGWADDPAVRNFPQVDEVIKAQQNGKFLPRTVVYNELADIMHRAVQNIMLNKADIKPTLDQAAAEYDRALDEFKKKQ